jgi:ribonuclease Z
MAEFAVTILGSGSAVPMHGRHPSAQVVQYEESFFLIDCGEGTQLLFREAGIKPFRIKVILISHLHGDHVFGLPGLLSSYSHLGRSEALTIFGPIGIQAFLESIIQYSELKIRFPMEIIELETTGLKIIYENANLEIQTFPLKHRIKCQGYLFREKKVPIRFNKQRLTELSLTPDQIKSVIQGEDITVQGKLISRENILLPPLAPLSYGYCSDTAYFPSLASWLKSVRVLYHEATFRNDLEELAVETGHSTAGEAAQIAVDAGAGCLMLGHYSSRYKLLDDLLAEAKAIFHNTVLSIEGKQYKIRELTEDSRQPDH